MKIILGSSSKYRKEVLQNEGFDFEVMVPDVDEKAIQTENPRERPLILAREKSKALIEKVKEPALILSFDNVVLGNGKLYEKPESIEEAREFLNDFNNGVVPECVSGVVVYNTVTKKSFEGIDSAKVIFKKFPPEMIEAFLQAGDPMTRAGGFGIQHEIMKPYVERIEGERQTVMGVPLTLVKNLIAKAS